MRWVILKSYPKKIGKIKLSPLVEADEKILCILKWLLEKSYTQSIFVYLNFTSKNQLSKMIFIGFLEIHLNEIWKENLFKLTSTPSEKDSF